MIRFLINNIEHSMGDALKRDTEFILIEALKQELLDQLPPSKIKSKQYIANEKALELKKKLDGLNSRLQNGFQLIKAKIIFEKPR